MSSHQIHALIAEVRHSVPRTLKVRDVEIVRAIGDACDDVYRQGLARQVTVSWFDAVVDRAVVRLMRSAETVQ
mgnify:CR=1 FL=1